MLGIIRKCVSQSQVLFVCISTCCVFSLPVQKNQQTSTFIKINMEVLSTMPVQCYRSFFLINAFLIDDGLTLTDRSTFSRKIYSTRLLLNVWSKKPASIELFVRYSNYSKLFRTSQCFVLVETSCLNVVTLSIYDKYTGISKHLP